MAGQDAGLYSESFYAELDGGARLAAGLVTPILLELTPVTSVLDVGCGVGSWLAVMSDSGVTDVTGIDGDLVPEELLQVPGRCVHRQDLSAPFDLGRRFDLVVSTEVAEHLPPPCADTFVRSIAAHTDLVAFSAAVPGQGGTGHVNEQWPSYWASLFEAQGFTTLDIIRPRIWDQSGDVFIIAQNLLVYARGDALQSLSGVERSAPWPIDLVHPRMVGATADQSLRGLAARVPGAIVRRLRGRSSQHR